MTEPILIEGNNMIVKGDIGFSGAASGNNDNYEIEIDIFNSRDINRSAPWSANLFYVDNVSLDGSLFEITSNLDNFLEGEYRINLKCTDKSTDETVEIDHHFIMDSKRPVDIKSVDSVYDAGNKTLDLVIHSGNISRNLVFFDISTYNEHSGGAAWSTAAGPNNGIGAPLSKNYTKHFTHLELEDGIYKGRISPKADPNFNLDLVNILDFSNLGINGSDGWTPKSRAYASDEKVKVKINDKAFSIREIIEDTETGEFSYVIEYDGITHTLKNTTIENGHKILTNNYRDVESRDIFSDLNNVTDNLVLDNMTLILFEEEKDGNLEKRLFGYIQGENNIDTRITHTIPVINMQDEIVRERDVAYIYKINAEGIHCNSAYWVVNMTREEKVEPCQLLIEDKSLAYFGPGDAYQLANNSRKISFEQGRGLLGVIESNSGPVHRVGVKLLNVESNPFRFGFEISSTEDNTQTEEPNDNNTDNNQTNESNETNPGSDNNTNNTNETQPETNKTEIYVPRDNDLIVRSFTCDSSVKAGNPKSTRWDLDIINPDDDKVYITTNTGKVLAYNNIDREHFEFLHFDVNGSDYLELRTLDTPGFKVEDSEIMERGFNASEFEKYGYSNPIRIAIPDLESCDVIDTTEDNTKKTIEPEAFSALSPADWAMYGVAGLSGLLALDVLANKLKERNRKKEEDDLGKWDTTEDFEKQFELEDLNALAAGLNGDSEE
jgi:hypothetical protein